MFNITDVVFFFFFYQFFIVKRFLNSNNYLILKSYFGVVRLIFLFSTYLFSYSYSLREFSWNELIHQSGIK